MVTTFALPIALVLSGLHVQANSPSMDQDARGSVEAVIKRCRSRDYSVLGNGIRKISWVSPTSDDYAEIKALGDSAVAPLSTAISGNNDFAQLLAVKFLESLRLAETIKPLETATASKNWVVVRLAAATALWYTSDSQARVWVRSMKDEPDPLISKRVGDLLREMPGTSDAKENEP